MVNGEGEQSPAKGISQAAIGRALGLAPSTITKLRGQGMPVTSVAEAQAWRELRQNSLQRKPEPKPAAALPTASARPAAPLPPAAPVPPMIRTLPQLPPDDDDGDFDFGESLDQARLRDKIAEANMREMAEAEMRGDLIRVAAVKATLGTVFATTRDALLQIPARLAPTLAADTDPASVMNALHAEIHQALHHLANAPASIGQDSPAP
jgi:hypothetical protein